MLTCSLECFLPSTRVYAIVLHNSKYQKRAVLSQFQISFNSYPWRTSCNSTFIYGSLSIGALLAFLLILNTYKLFLLLKLANHPANAEKLLISSKLAHSFAFYWIISLLIVKFLEIYWSIQMIITSFNCG